MLPLRRASALSILALVTTLGCTAGTRVRDVDSFREIQRLEDLRPDGAEARLARYLTDRDIVPLSRIRAATALGRIGSAEAVTPLCTALGEPDTELRVQVAFALGQLQDTGARVQALGAILPMLRTPDPAFRARLVEAIGKIGSLDHGTQVLELLRDSDVGVRCASALALHRLRTRAARENIDETKRAESDASIRDALLAALSKELETEARWRFVYVLGGLRDRATLEPMLAAIESQQQWERLFAVRGIAELVRARRVPTVARTRVESALMRRLDDTDSRIAVEAALALGDPSPSGRNTSPPGTGPNFASRVALDALIAKLDDESSNVVEAAVQAIGHYSVEGLDTSASNALSLAIASTKIRIRAAGIESAARLSGDKGHGVLSIYAKDEDWRTRCAAARATRFFGDGAALGILASLAADEDRRVRLATLGSLGRRKSTPRAITIVQNLLAEADPAVREESAATLGRLNATSAVPALREALAASRAPSFADARVEIITALAKIAPRDPLTPDLFEAALQDPTNRVRRAAHGALVARGDSRAIPPLRLTDEGRQFLTPGTDYPMQFLRSKPRVRLETTKGVLVLELEPAHAPTHCWNLLHIVDKGAYDGRIFHRVVPNFVVQGGDARGDGYGNTAWWGGTLRREVSTLEFGAYALGMPRGPDVDSGGDQIFVTTVPTPHLDGRYTCFGRVVEGTKVLLEIEIGDRIERATSLR